jgi:hypothetical protein
MTQVSAGLSGGVADVEHVREGSSTDVAVYPVIADPLSSGAVQRIRARSSPAVAVGAAGWLGLLGACGVTALDGSDATESPLSLVATKVKV